MSGKIAVVDHKIHCIIGCLPQERTQSQDLFVDLEIAYDFSRGAREDCLDGTISYVDLANDATRIALEGRFRLIEAYAEALLTALGRPGVSWARVRVKKPGAIESARFAAVDLERTWSLT